MKLHNLAASTRSSIYPKLIFCFFPIDDVKVEDGQFFYQLTFTFESNLSQIIRIPKTLAAIEDLEIEWLVGPIDVSLNGKEYIHKFKLHDANNQGEFFTGKKKEGSVKGKI